MNEQPNATSIRESADPAGPSRKEAMWAYLERGWFLVPLNGLHADGTCRCRFGRGCHSPGKHPLGRLARHGWRDASIYPPTVERWLRIHPEMNVGVVTGPSRLASLDIDPRNGGDESLERLIEEQGPLPETLTLLTGGGGRQYIFSDPDRMVWKGNPRPGIDVLGGPSLFVAPPSHHWTGGTYRWEDWDLPLAPVPLWMVKAT